MEKPLSWAARAWLPYLLAGIAWVTLGAAVLGLPRRQGLVFIGLVCLAVGGYGLTRRRTTDR